MQPQKVIIVGAGFAGIRTALDLSKKSDFEITLISKNDRFEYYPGLHKLVGVSHHVTAQIPLQTIFQGKSVTLVTETVTAVNAHTKTVTTDKGNYTADYLVLAMGSQTEYFGISGLPEMAFGFKSIDEALKLRNHIEQLFAKHVKTDKAESVVGLHMVIVGAGPNGVDLAGELAALGHMLAKKYGIVESLLTIDLIEASSRVLSMMPESVSYNVEARLRTLGINILCNRDLRKEESWTVTLADMTLGAKTLVWTAGITTNELVKNIEGFQLAKKNRVTVDEFLQAKGFQNVFVVGDVADTQYSGLAQTAIYDGAYVAQVITKKSEGKHFPSYVPKPIAYNIGVGPRWSVLMWGKLVMYGLGAYIMRTLIDVRFFLSILSPGQVYRMYFPKR